MRLRSLNRYLPVAITAATFALIAITPDVALANGTGGGPAGGGTAIDFSSVNASINAAIGLMTGPIMKLVAIIAVLSGAFMLMQGRELAEGPKVLAILAVTIGLLIGGVNIMNGIGADVLAYMPVTGMA